MIHSKRVLIAAGLAVMVIGLITSFPARVAVSWFAPPGIAIAGIEGTAWSGSANEVVANGLHLTNLQWDLQPLRLFTGKLAYGIEASIPSGFIETDVGLGIGGSLTITDLRAALPLNLIAGAAGLPGLAGNASLAFDRVVVADGMAQTADGTLQIANLVVPIVDRSSLGGYKAEITTAADGISAIIEETDGIVEIDGSLDIKSDRSFAFVALVIAKSDTPENVRKQLDFLPPANDRGQRELRLEGIL